mgnify:CR=1 FL=1
MPPDEILKGLEAGAVDFITKPVLAPIGVTKPRAVLVHVTLLPVWSVLSLNAP